MTAAKLKIVKLFFYEFINLDSKKNIPGLLRAGFGEAH